MYMDIKLLFHQSGLGPQHRIVIHNSAKLAAKAQVYWKAEIERCDDDSRLPL